MSEPDLIVVGKVTSTHGVRGELKVFNETEVELGSVQALYILRKGAAKEKAELIEIETERPHKNGLLVRFKGVDTKEAADGLKGSDLLIEAKDLPELPDGEYYYFELVGMEVATEDGKPLGEIKNVIATGGNDVYEVSGEGGEILLPAIPEVVLDVDRLKRRMIVRLIEGLT